jgi:NAD(P)-dependent dehydrogenase (short-subunit alcohol dehydrogenase family)
MSEIKTVVITGVSRGLGEALVRHFLLFSKDQWNVVGLSRSEFPSLPAGYSYDHKNVDIRDSEAVKEALKDVGTIDVLINNAAFFKQSLFEMMNMEDIENTIDTNLLGSIYTTKVCLPKIKPGGRIIFINSVAGLEEIEYQSIYCASKHALTAFAGVLGLELRSRRIHVTSIHPGGMNTPLWNNNNPYPLGDATKALKPGEVCRVVDFIVNSPPEVEYKTIKLFPSIEWH